MHTFMKFFENDRGLISKLSTTNINFNVQQFYKDYIPHLSIYEHEMYAYKITFPPLIITDFLIDKSPWLIHLNC